MISNYFNLLYISQISNLYRFNFEMKTNEGKHETLQILYQVIESTEAFRITRLVNINQ